MLIEKALEEKVLTSIAAVLPATHKHILAGFWQPTAPGKLKGLEEDPEATALVETSLGLGNQATFSDPNVTFPLSVQLTVRLELDPQGQKLLDFTEPMHNLFKGWMAATYQQTFTALDIDGLSVDEVSVGGGSPVLDTSAMVGRVKWDITLAGSYRPSTNNPET